MIRHAPEAAAFPVGSLPVAVIEPSLPALLVSPVGGPPLLPPRFLSAPVPAVDLPPIAGTADVEHRPATRPAAEQPPQHHFSGHRSPARVWTTALCRGTPAWLWSCPLNGAAMKKPRSLPRPGFSFLRFGSALPEPRQASALRRTQSLAIGAHPKTAGPGACLHRTEILYANTFSAPSFESEMLAGTGETED